MFNFSAGFLSVGLTRPKNYSVAGFQKMGLNLAGFAKMGLMVAAGLGESDSEELQVANGTRSRRLWQSPPHASLQQ